MPRKPLIRSNEFPYHVTARGNNREIFPCGATEVWTQIGEHLEEISFRFQARIHAFVLMPNHFHLLISTPVEDLGIIMHFFMASVTKTLNAKSGRSGRVFGGRYHWSIIDSLNYLDCATKYVYRNPVKAKLVERVEDYPFSTINQALGLARPNFPLHPFIGTNSLIPDDQKTEFLNWLNVPFPTEQEEEIRKGFKKTTFFPSRIGWKKKEISIERFSASAHKK